MGAQIAAALAAAHEQGVIHRDLKPGNVILTSRGQTKLLDFGLALLCPSVAAHTETRSIADSGRLVGTVPYMSPEQILGREVDERSDIYSLGVILFEMATGRRPFAATVSTALMNEILHRPAPSPGVHGARLAPALEALIVSMLEKDPKRRPESAARVEAALRSRDGASPHPRRRLRPRQRRSPRSRGDESSRSSFCRSRTCPTIRSRSISRTG